MIYLLCSGILFSKTVNTILVAKLIILDVFFLTSFILALRATVAAKLVILGISFLISFILGVKVVLVASLVTSGILSSVSLILALDTSFLAASFFITFFSLLKSTGKVLIYQHLIYPLYFSNCLNHLVLFLIYYFLILGLLNQTF